MAVMTNIDAITRTLQEEMRRDPNIFITGEDVGVRGGVFRATKGLIEEFGDKRVVDAPLAELSIVATGIGAAKVPRFWRQKPIAQYRTRPTMMIAHIARAKKWNYGRKKTRCY